MTVIARVEPPRAPAEPSAAIVRYRHLALAVVATVMVLLTATDRGFDLDFLVAGARGLAGHSTAYFGVPPGPSRGLHLYAAVPGLQVGPLSLLFLLGTGVAWGDPGHIACLVATALGLVSLALIERAAGRTSLRSTTTLIVGGAAVCVCWADTVQRWGHVDDALVTFFAAATILALRRERWALAGLAVGLAIAAKPTALPMMAMLATGPGALWPIAAGRLRALGVATALSAAAYLPFVLADHRTLRARTPELSVQPASVLHLFAVPNGVADSAWVRLAQLALGVGVGLWATRWHGPMAGLLAISAARLVLDPGDYSYYALPLVLAAVGLALERERRPILAWVATLVFVVLPWVVLARYRWEGLLTLAVCAAAITTAVRGNPRSTSSLRTTPYAQDRAPV